MMLRITYIFLIVQILAPVQLADLLSGNKEYIFGIPDSLATPNAIRLYISTVFSTSVQVEAPFIGYNYSHHLNQNSISLSLNTDLQMQGSSVAKKSVYIRSEHEVFVHVIIVERGSSDGYLVQPLKVHSTEFFIITYDKASNSANQVIMAALLDNTNVQIQVKLSTDVINFNGKTFTNGQTIRKTLNKFDVLQLQSPGDLTGTYIKSSQPISVLSGNKCMSIRGYCDVTVEQMKPLADWKTEFLISVFENDVATVTRFVAAEANTNIVINGKYIGSIGRGKYIEKRDQTTSLEFVQASKPLEIVQYHDIRNSDVFMLNIPAIDEFITDYVFEVSSDFPNNFLEFYIETGKLDGIRLDGNPITTTNQRRVYVASLHKSFSAAKLTVRPGQHKLTHTDTVTRFGAILYGTGRVFSYGLFLGYLDDPVCSPPCVNEGKCIANDICHCLLGFRGRRCELGHALTEDLKPKLYTLVDGEDNNFMDPRAWYSNPPFSDSNKVCYIKILVKNSPLNTILSAISSTTAGENYGNFTVGPVDANSDINGSIRFACLEVRCPFVTISGVYSNTTVTVSVDGNNNRKCIVSNSNQHVSNFTVQSYSGKSDKFELTLEVGKNYGPYYGIYMAIGNRNKAKFISEHKCNSGREYDYQSYNPSLGVLAEYTC